MARLSISPTDRAALERLRSETDRAQTFRDVTIVLLSAEGRTRGDLSLTLGCPATVIDAARRRYRRHGPSGLDQKPGPEGPAATGAVEQAPSPEVATDADALPSPRGYCLAIGLNSVDVDSPAYHGALIPPLNGCVNDAHAIAELVRGLPHYTVPTVLTEATEAKPTHDRVLAALSDAAERLRPGDFFLVHFSGHAMRGGIRDGRPDPDAPDGASWILYDRPLALDELYHAWFQFAPHVSILVLSDTSLSGAGVVAGGFGPASPKQGLDDPARSVPTCLVERGLPALARLQILSNNLAYYLRRQASVRSLTITAAAPRANVVLLSACEEAGIALEGSDTEGKPHGLFTSALLEVYDQGRFPGDTNAFFNEIRYRTDARSQEVLPGRRQYPYFAWLGGNFFDLGRIGRLKPPFRIPT